jgi:hypothetical protein
MFVLFSEMCTDLNTTKTRVGSAWFVATFFTERVELSIAWCRTQHISWCRTQHISWCRTQHISWGQTQHISWCRTQDIAWGQTQHISWCRTQHISWGQTQHITWCQTKHISWDRTQHISWGNSQHISWGQTEQVSTDLKSCNPNISTVSFSLRWHQSATVHNTSVPLHTKQIMSPLTRPSGEFTYPDNGNSDFLWNFGASLPDCTTSHLITQPSSWPPQ